MISRRPQGIDDLVRFGSTRQTSPCRFPQDIRVSRSPGNRAIASFRGFPLSALGEWPARAARAVALHPKRPEYDTFDIAPFLRPGRNAIVAMVHHYAGVTSGRIIRHAPGFTALLVADGQEILHTGPDWKCSSETEYQASPGAWSSIPDVIDGRKWPGDWTAADFDDSAWQSAIAIDGSGWGDFQPRITPLCMEAELTGLRRMPDGKPLEICSRWSCVPEKRARGTIPVDSLASGCGLPVRRRPCASRRSGAMPGSAWARTRRSWCAATTASRYSTMAGKSRAARMWQADGPVGSTWPMATCSPSRRRILKTATRRRDCSSRCSITATRSSVPGISRARSARWRMTGNPVPT